MNRDFNKKSEYDNEIKKKKKKVLLLCEKAKIPVFMTFAVTNEKGETTYINEMLSAGFEGVVLYDDQIAKHALVYNGFEVVPKRLQPTIVDEMEVV